MAVEEGVVRSACVSIPFDSDDFGIFVFDTCSEVSEGSGSCYELGRFTFGGAGLTRIVRVEAFPLPYLNVVREFVSAFGKNNERSGFVENGFCRWNPIVSRHGVVVIDIREQGSLRVAEGYANRVTGSAEAVQGLDRSGIGGADENLLVLNIRLDEI